jgi:hypothetical protein
MSVKREKTNAAYLLCMIRKKKLISTKNLICTEKFGLPYLYVERTCVLWEIDPELLVKLPQEEAMKTPAGEDANFSGPVTTRTLGNRPRAIGKITTSRRSYEDAGRRRCQILRAGDDASFSVDQETERKT